MSYKIVVDSCGELKPEQKSDIHFASASLELDVDDYHVVDDESFDQSEGESELPEVYLPVPGALYDSV